MYLNESMYLRMGDLSRMGNTSSIVVAVLLTGLADSTGKLQQPIKMSLFLICNQNLMVNIPFPYSDIVRMEDYTMRIQYLDS